MGVFNCRGKWVHRVISSGIVPGSGRSVSPSGGSRLRDHSSLADGASGAAQVRPVDTCRLQRLRAKLIIYARIGNGQRKIKCQLRCWRSLNNNVEIIRRPSEVATEFSRSLRRNNNCLSKSCLSKDQSLSCVHGPARQCRRERS